MIVRLLPYKSQLVNKIICLDKNYNDKNLHGISIYLLEEIIESIKNGKPIYRVMYNYKMVNLRKGLKHE